LLITTKLNDLQHYTFNHESNIKLDKCCITHHNW